MQENLVWAAGHDVFAVPLAAGVLAPIGSCSRQPSARFTSSSTVIVAIDAQFLRRVSLDLPSLPGVSVPGEPHPAD